MAVDEASPTDPALLRQLFPGGSEMARRMRELDWSTTSLGPPAQWPPHLRLAVSLCLTSRFPILLWWGVDLTVLYNDAYISFLGPKHPWALGRPGSECWSEIWASIGPMLQSVMATGEATWSEDVQYFFARRLPAEEVFVRFTYGPILSAEGQVDGVFTPCTETTGAVVSARRLQTLTRLSASDVKTANLETACHSAVQALTSSPLDTPFAAIYVMEGHAGRLVSSSEPAAGTGLPEIVPLAPDEGDEIAQRIATAFTSESAAIAPFETSALTVTGAPYPERLQRWLVIPLAAVRPETAAVLVLALSPRCPWDDAYRDFFGLVVRHVGELLNTALRYERERARVEALAELDRAKTLFFSNVSHELRTPLTLMLGPLDVALQGHVEARDELLMVRRNAQRLHKLVETLLDFSRLEAGRLVAQLEATDLAAATADVASLFRSMIEAAGLRLLVDCPPLMRAYRVDRDMWEKIVSNLLSNAYKYTLAGEVRVRLGEWPGGVELAVSDTGVGISEQDQQRLFERFVRVNRGAGRTEEGTGIGLALVRELVHLHGGSIGVDSAPDRGSTFAVRLPATLAEAPHAKVRPWHGSAPAPVDATHPLSLAPSEREHAANGGRSLILIADDNEDVRSYLRKVLAPHWDTASVADGQAALEAIAHRPPDLLLCDVMMPRVDGLALVQRIRADEAMRRLPVILLSARVGEDAKVAGLAAGADDYLTKPFSNKELLARIEAQLMRARIDGVQKHFSSRLAAVLEQAPVGIAVTVGPEHVFEFANEHYRRFVPDRTLIGRSLRDNFPDLRGQGVFELFDEVYRSGEPFVASPLKVRLRSPDTGELEERHFDLVYQPLFGQDGAVNGIAVVASDVHQVLVARAAAEEANRAKDQFIAMLGHELRNPLAPIASAVHLLRQAEAGTQPAELDIIDRQVHHMVRLIDDLLDVSRITRGAVELRRERVELWSIVDKAIETASPLIEQRGHRLAVQVGRTGLPVWADSDRLSQVVSNLLANAAKYTPPGGTVQMKAERQDDSILLHVVDNGLGMTAQEQERVFDLFVQGHQPSDRPVGGLGLGLSIARSLTALHGGRLECRSEGPGRGCTFSLTLPLYDGQSVPALQPPALPQPAAAQALDVLIVDDNVDAAESLARILRKAGCRVRVAHDGAAALADLAGTAVDLALLDIGLPDMDGHELGQRLRELQPTRSLRLVAVSGFGQQADVDQSLQRGFEQHLVKPVDLRRLLQLLH